MKILMVTDTLYGGGAQLMVRSLATELVGKGHQVSVLTESPGTGMSEVQVISYPSLVQFARRVARRVRPLDRAFSAWCYRAMLTRALARVRPELAHVHNLHSSQTFRSNPWVYEFLGRAAPVVVTLHDMWSFTGRCAYHLGCELFLSECDHTCPTPAEYPVLEPERIRPAFQNKRNAFSRIPSLAFVAPSRWMQAEAKRGMLRGHRVEHISNGIDLSVFRPRDKAESRRRLGLPESGTLLMTASLHSSSHLKNTGLVARALDSEKLEGVRTLVAAQDSRTAQRDERFIPLGYISDRDTMAMAYSAADLYVHPALAESFGLVIAEALACGTPVVAMNRSAMPELVIDGVTGWLSGPAPEDFASAIVTGLEALKSGRQMADTCRGHVVGHCDLKVIVEQHVELYQELAGAAR